MTLACLADYMDGGGNKATCQNGELIPTDDPPKCFSLRIRKLMECSICQTPLEPPPPYLPTSPPPRLPTSPPPHLPTSPPPHLPTSPPPHLPTSPPPHLPTSPPPHLPTSPPPHLPTSPPPHLPTSPPPHLPTSPPPHLPTSPPPHLPNYPPPQLPTLPQISLLPTRLLQDTECAEYRITIMIIKFNIIIYEDWGVMLADLPSLFLIVIQ